MVVDGGGRGGGGGGGWVFFFFNDTATTEIYTLSLHDALPIYPTEVLHYKSSVTIRCDGIPVVCE